MIHGRRGERRASNHFAKSLCYGTGTRLVGAAEHDKELIAAPPAHLTLIFDNSCQAGGKLNQHVVDRVSAKFFIDLIDVVYVKHEYSERLGEGTAHLLRKHADASRPIPEFCERVALCLVTQSGDLPLLRGPTLATLSLSTRVIWRQAILGCALRLAAFSSIGLAFRRRQLTLRLL